MRTMFAGVAHGPDTGTPNPILIAVLCPPSTLSPVTPPARPPLTPLEHDLAGLGRSLAGAPGEPVALPTRNDAVVVRVGDVVVKAHAPGTDPHALQARLAACARLRGIALPPLKTTVTWVGGRPVTLWPAGEPVDHADPDAAPWEDAARLLAALH